MQITSAFWEHEIGELKGSNMELNDLRHGVVPVSKNLVNDMLICSSDYEGLIENSQMVRNPVILREPSKEEGIINSVNSKSVCSQEVVTDLLPETYTQSLLNVPNGDLVAVKIDGSNVQTNGQGRHLKRTQNMENNKKPSFRNVWTLADTDKSASGEWGAIAQWSWARINGWSCFCRNKDSNSGLIQIQSCREDDAKSFEASSSHVGLVWRFGSGGQLMCHPWNFINVRNYELRHQ
ncbi:hypothetical protein TNCV_540401 [Trichonephila clavipes]|nr:hypothetical protein TNCV_540401 [Trichonephila clavipes]